MNTLNKTKTWTAAGDAGQDGVDRRSDGAGQGLCGLVFEIGALDEMALNALFKHGAMIPFDF